MTDKIIIIWQAIPDWMKIFVIDEADFPQNILQFLPSIHGKFSNLMETTPDEEMNIVKLYKFLDNHIPVFDDAKNGFKPVEIEQSTRLYVTGQVMM